MKKVSNLLKKWVTNLVFYAILGVAFFGLIGSPEARKDTYQTVESLGKEVGRKAKYGKKSTVEWFKTTDWEQSWNNARKGLENMNKDWEKRSSRRNKKEKKM